MIKAASATDEPAVRACAEEAFAPYVPLIGRKPAPMTADYETLIAAGHVYVAVDHQNELHGFVVFFAEDDHVVLDTVAVLPCAAGQGVGKALIQFCEQAARALGLNAVHLYTNEKMHANLSIYPRLGFAEALLAPRRVHQHHPHRLRYHHEPLEPLDQPEARLVQDISPLAEMMSRPSMMRRSVSSSSHRDREPKHWLCPRLWRERDARSRPSSPRKAVLF